MALPHAQTLDVIDLRPLGERLDQAVTSSLLKIPTLQLMRLVLHAGASVPEHAVPGAITLQCLEGEVTLTTPSRTCRLGAGHLVVLDGGEPHALRAVTDASLLVTILLQAQ